MNESMANAQGSSNINFETISDKTYGDFALFPLQASHSLGKTISFKSSDNSIIDVREHEIGWYGQPSVPGTVTITAYSGTPGGADYEEVVQTVTVKKATLRVRATPQFRGYGQKNPIVNAEYTYEGFKVPEDEMRFDDLPIAYIDPIYDEYTAIGVYDDAVIVKGGSHPYYDLVYTKATLRVTVLIEFTEINTKTYGDAPFQLIKDSYGIAEMNVTSSNPEVLEVSEVDGEWIATIKGAVEPGENVIITIESTDITGYESKNENIFIVNPAPLRITADNKSRLIGQQNPELTYTVEGLVYDETLEVLTEITISTDATPYSPADVYEIVIRGGENKNYNTIITNGELTVRGFNFLGILVNDVEHDINVPYDMGSSETNEQIVQVLTAPNSVVTVPGHSLTLDNKFRVITDKPMVKEIEIIVGPQENSEGEVEKYTLIIERRFIFDKIGIMRWNNTLSIVNNPTQLFGYTIDGYQWYRDNIALAGETKQYYSAGPSEYDLLSETSKYHVELKMATGEVLRTSEKQVELTNTQNIRITPNPATTGETVTLTIDMDDDLLLGAKADIFNLNGVFQKSVPVMSKTTTFIVSNVPGMYLIKVTTTNGFTKTIKVLVK